MSQLSEGVEPAGPLRWSEMRSTITDLGQQAHRDEGASQSHTASQSVTGPRAECLPGGLGNREESFHRLGQLGQECQWPEAAGLPLLGQEYGCSGVIL